MTSDDRTFGASDDLDLLRQEAAELGMPAEITPSSVGITLRLPSDIIRSAASSRPARSRKKYALRIGALAASIAAIAAVTLVPWQQEKALAGLPPVLEYQFADVHHIADAPGKDARAALLKLARTAGTQDAQPVSGTTQLVQTESWYAEIAEDEDSKLVPSRREQWFRADSSMRIREAFGQPLNLDGRGLSITEKGDAVVVHNETYPAEETSSDPQFVANLGGDDRQVRAQLIEVAGCDDKYAPIGECLYYEISSAFLTHVVPPRVAAAFWRILADEPSLRSLGTVKDRAGRPGIGISLIAKEHPAFRKVLIISSETGQLIGSEEILIKPVPDITFTPPAIMSFTAILESRYTNAVGPKD